MDDDALPWQKLAVALDRLVAGDAGGGELMDYDGRVQAMLERLVSKGIIDRDHVDARMARLAVRLANDRDRAPLKAKYTNAGPNDIGGLPAGPVDRRESAAAAWALHTVALRGALGEAGLVNIHELRRAVEDLGDDYHRLGHYQRALQATANVLYEKGVLSPGEVEKKMRRRNHG